MTRHRALTYIHIAAILFGLTGVFGELIQASAAVITLGRAVFAVISLGLFARMRRRPLLGALTPAQLFVLVVAGALLAAHWVTFFISVKVGGIAIATLGFASFPAFITLFEGLIFRERVRLAEWLLLGLVTAGLVLVIGQIALGGWVSSNYAAVACIDLPTCHGQWWPNMDFANGFHLTQHIGPNYLGGQLDSDARTAIHMTHRIGAVLVTLVLLGLAWQLRQTGMTRLAGLVLVALGAQVSLGLSNVFFHLPLPVAVAHNAGGAALLLTLVLVNYHARTSLVRARDRLPLGWRLSPRKQMAGPITIKGEMPWRL